MRTIRISSAEAFRKYMDEGDFLKITRFGTVSEMWEHCLAQYSDLTALEYDGIACSYEDIEKKAACLRSEINKTFIEKGTRIGLLAENSISFVAGFLSIVTAGYSAVVFPAQLDETSVSCCLEKYHAAGLLYTQNLKAVVSKAAGFLPAINIDEKIYAVDNCKQCAKTDTDFADDAKSDTGVSLKEEVFGRSPLKLCKPEDECVILFTSGSTGNNKAVILNNQAVSAGVANGCYGYRNVFRQKYICVLPFSHAFGLIRTLLTALYTGSSLFICKNNKDMFRDIASFKPTMLVAVPAIVDLGLKLSAQLRRNMFGSQMKTIITGAAPVSPFLVSECAKLGINLCPGYGLTESANLISGNPDSVNHPDSVGLPFPHQELKTVNGELFVKGINITKGYADPSDTEEAFEDGWFKTGDLMNFDGEGFLYFTGRTKELIVLQNGENVSPMKIEAVFNTLSFIQDSYVYEDVTDKGNSVLALEVVLRDSELKGMSSEDKKAFALEKLNKINHTLPSYERVNRIIIRDTDFERTPSMKILRYRSKIQK